MIFKAEASDGIVVKQIKHGQVRTSNIIDGKECYIKTNDIKRLGYKTIEEYVEYLEENGYKKEDGE